MAAPDLTFVVPITMNKNSSTNLEKPKEYGFLLVLAALALVMWLFSRFFGWGHSTKPVLSKKAEKLQREIETLEILQEQAKLDLRRVRLEQKTLHLKKTTKSQMRLHSRSQQKTHRRKMDTSRKHNDDELELA